MKDDEIIKEDSNEDLFAADDMKLNRVKQTTNQPMSSSPQNNNNAMMMRNQSNRLSKENLASNQQQQQQQLPVIDNDISEEYVLVYSKNPTPNQSNGNTNTNNGNAASKPRSTTMPINRTASIEITNKANSNEELASCSPNLNKLEVFLAENKNEPLPVPTQMDNYRQMMLKYSKPLSSSPQQQQQQHSLVAIAQLQQYSSSPSAASPSPNANRSPQNDSMTSNTQQQQPHHHRSDTEIAQSISPPTVKFLIGASPSSNDLLRGMPIRTPNAGIPILSNHQQIAIKSQQTEYGSLGSVNYFNSNTLQSTAANGSNNSINVNNIQELNNQSAVNDGKHLIPTYFDDLEEDTLLDVRVYC